MREKFVQNTIPFILEVITPVTIGNGQDLKVLDYILDTAKQKVYILNQKKWLQYLYSIDKLSEYELYVENYTKGQKETIYEWMERTIGIPDDSVLLSVSKRQLQCVTSSFSKKTLNDIKLCMSLPDGTPYIPGSSLKGVIISALISHIITNDKDFLINNDENFRKKWRDKFTKAFKNNSCLHRCIKEYRKALGTMTVSSRKEPIKSDNRIDVKKLFHGISVSDIMLSNNDSMATYILPRFDSVISADTTTPTTTIKSLPIYRECIVPNTKLNGMLNVDLTVFDKIKMDLKSDLIEIIEEHTQRLVSRWKLAFNNGIEESCIQELEQVTCLLGSSVGFLHKTLLLPLFDNHEGEVNVVKAILNLQSTSKKHKHWQDKIISPRTLKLTKYKGRDYIFGGVKLHLENN